MKGPILLVGGMGPQASAEAHVRVVKKAAELGIEMPEIIVLSLPVPDFISSDDNIEAAFTMIVSETKKAAAFEPAVAMIACNTAHILLPRLQAASPNVPFRSLIDAVIDDLKQKQARKVGLLASPTTIRTKLYQDALEKAAISCKLPTKQQQARLERMIRAFIDTNEAGDSRRELHELVSEFLGDGCDHVLLGCTELPIILGPSNDARIANSLDILCSTLLRDFNNSDIIGLTNE